jgi:uncharacterized protein (DUF169 family)
MATTQDWSAQASALREHLGTDVPPIGITFHDEVPTAPAAFDDPMPPPTEDGRTGRVSAGCVFWMKSTDQGFTTLPADHGNCSVGSMTHGIKTMEEVAGNADVAALLECGWVTEEIVPQIPVVTTRPAAVTYEPLTEATFDPDVVLLRLSGRQLMVLMDAVPGLRVEGKPQCHIVAIAKEQGEIAASVGCQLSRVRTGMTNAEMTCAVPGNAVAGLIEALATTAAADQAVAAYAAEDSRRFAPV